eukprot:4405622-Lingulodinium_polyedra.AAC.1
MMTLEEYYQWWRTTCQAAVKTHAASATAGEHVTQEGSGNAPAKKSGSGDAPPTPLDSGVWADFFARGR